MRTDHASLQWLYRRKEPSHQVARWLKLLAEFHFLLSHRAGAEHGNADGLSRCCIGCKQCNSVRRRHGGTSWTELQEEDNMKIGNGLILEGRAPTIPPVRDSKILEGRDIAACRISTADKRRKDVPQLQQAQGSDIALIRECIEKGVDLPTGTLEQGSNELKKLYSLMPVMEIQDNLLKVRLRVNKTHTWCIVFPKQLRLVIIQQYHSQHHSGVNKT